jgi:putative endonuclease
MNTPNVVLPVSEWRDPRHRRGIAGEIFAARYLEAKGWIIQAHRYRIRHFDIDLVARRGPIVAFIEVKTRVSRIATGETLEDILRTSAQSIGRRKQTAIGLAARGWIAYRGRPHDLYRFDLLVVHVDAGGRWDVRHLANAWSWRERR